MNVSQLFLPAALAVLLVTVPCYSLEDTGNGPDVVDPVSNGNPSQATLETDQLHLRGQDGSPRNDFEDHDVTNSETPPALHSEEISKDGDTAEPSVETEGSETDSEMKTLNEGADCDHCSEEDNDQPTKPSSKLVLQAFGSRDESGDESEDSERTDKEEEIWTEETEEGTEQKRSGRRFFSLMNLIKFLLNPVIEEFQEMEKSSTAQEGATATDANNQSDAVVMSAANSSDVGDKEKKNSTESGKKNKFQCVGRNVTENTTAVVRIVNSTVLLELLSFDKNHSTSDCVLVMFYAPWCHFCAATAPHYNAIARAFPQLEVLAVDTVHFSNLNARFGTVAVPNIMLFHQSRSAVRFNHTERHFNTLVQFITNTTGLEANDSVELSPEDYEGPLSSTPTEETDYLLWFAWFFIIICSGHIFISSQIGQRAIERVMVLWQEHQHQHIE